MRKRAAGIGIRMPTATHGEKSGAWLDGGGVGSEHQLRVLYTIQLEATNGVSVAAVLGGTPSRPPRRRHGVHGTFIRWILISASTSADSSLRRAAGSFVIT